MIILPSGIKKLFSIFRNKGFELYMVGGAVRDSFLNKEVTNWDFATNATPDKILKLFPQGFYNNTYGTVGVTQEIEKKQLLFEITTYRKEGVYTDFRHPQKVAWAKTIQEDLGRRDFTINAMAYDGKTLIDPYHGERHLKDKIIVAVGEPDLRFTEDALRLIRGVRFASQLGFLIEERTRDSIQRNAKLITNISWERVRDELLKILASDHPSEGILFLRSTTLLQYILPELEACFSVQQKSPKRHHIYDVGTHLVMSLKHCPSQDVITRLASLLHDIGKVPTHRKDAKTQLITFYNHEVVGTNLVEKIADRLRLSNKQKEQLIQLVKYHQFTVSELQTDKAVRRFIRNIGKEYLQELLHLRTADRIGSGATPTSWRLELFKKRIEEVQKEPFKVSDLKINGNDVMKILDIKPGPKIGEILKKLFDQVVDKKISNEHDALLGELAKDSS